MLVAFYGVPDSNYGSDVGVGKNERRHQIAATNGHTKGPAATTKSAIYLVQQQMELRMPNK